MLKHFVIVVIDCGPSTTGTARLFNAGSTSETAVFKLVVTAVVLHGARVPGNYFSIRLPSVIDEGKS